MITIPANLIVEKNKLNAKDPWLVLLDIDLNNPTGADPPTIYVANNTEDVEYLGNTYQASKFSLETAKQDSKGRIVPTTLKIANINSLIREYVEEFDGGNGSAVKVTFVNAGHLTETDYSELELNFSSLSCFVSVKWITFTLGGPSLLNRRYPLDKYLPSHCNWQFGSAECSYVIGVTGPFTECNRSFEDCQERDMTVRFGSYMGLERGGINVV